MHLIPADRAGMRMIDGERVCDAIAALGDTDTVAQWAQRYSLLGDPTRLALLICIARVGPISVSDLAVATGLSDATVSQALRFLRTSGAVSAERAGRVMRYLLVDHNLAPLLDAVPSAQRTAH